MEEVVLVEVQSDEADRERQQEQPDPESSTTHAGPTIARPEFSLVRWSPPGAECTQGDERGQEKAGRPAGGRRLPERPVGRGVDPAYDHGVSVRGALAPDGSAPRVGMACHDHLSEVRTVGTNRHGKRRAQRVTTQLLLRDVPAFDPAVVKLELAVPEPEVVRIVKEDGHSPGKARDPPRHGRAGPDAGRRERHVLPDRPHGEEDEEQDGGRLRQESYPPRDPVLDP